MLTRSSMWYAAVILAASALSLMLATPASAQKLSVELSMGQSEYRQGDSVKLTYTLRNEESRPVTILKWNTPLEGIIGDPFVVSHGGTEITYFGVMVERLAAGPGDWATIPAKGSVTATVDLTQGYDLSAAGDYEVHLRYGLQHATFKAVSKLPLNQLRPQAVDSNKASFRMLDAGTPRPAPTHAKPAAPQGISNFVGCSQSQQDSLNKAYADLVTDAPKVSTAVAGWGGSCTNWTNTPSATTFLGPGTSCSSSSLAQVQSVTSQVTNYEQGTVNIDCTGTNSCAPGPSACGTAPPGYVTLAFTCLGGGNRTIYVCPGSGAFFSLPVNGDLPSQEGTLYHELSHWAYTRDYAYGCQDCANLAQSNSAEAQNNADSYTYFAGWFVRGGNPDCGVEYLALAAPLVALLIQGIGRRRLLRKRSV